MARRAPARRSRRRTYRRRPQNVSYNKVITRGIRTLDGSNRLEVVDLTANAEAAGFYGVDLTRRGNAVVGLRGNWWYWTDASEGVQTAGYLSCGIISENNDMRTQIDTEAEQVQVGPGDIEGRYRPWHYRRTIPVINRYSSTTGTDLVDIPFDQAQQVMLSRQGIGARRAEKFRSVRDGYFMYWQIDDAIDYSVVVSWQLEFTIREP